MCVKDGRGNAAIWGTEGLRPTCADDCAGEPLGGLALCDGGHSLGNATPANDFSDSEDVLPPRVAGHYNTLFIISVWPSV